MNTAQAEEEATVDTGQIEKEVHASFQGLVDACGALDAERYFSYFDKERFTGLNVDGKVWLSIKGLEQLIVPGFEAVDKIALLEFDNVKVTVINATTAILVNEYRETVRLKDGTEARQAGGGLQVWSRTGTGWKLVSVAASAAPG